MVVFKEGPADKLLGEKKCVDRWNELLPGFAPQIYSFQHREDSGAILFEYLPGRTFEELVLRSEPRLLSEGLEHLQASLREIWTRTREDRPTRSDFIHQIAKRIDSVYELHPDFRTGNVSFGGLQVDPFDSLIERLLPIDDLLESPFSVLGHGDLNIDNVIFDDAQKAIRFIDLHRSRPMDYAQDLSVFLVSHFRLQVLELPVRRRIQDVIGVMHDFAVDFADEVGDETFGVRLAAGLARSFTTSARFVLDEEFAKSLFFRGRYLLEQLAAQTEETLLDYEAPGDILLD
jgi:aminoglycoside phosphotransferase